VEVGLPRTAVRCAIAMLAVAIPGSAGAVPVLGPTGNYYELIATPMTWENARTAALGMSFLGEQGYLATVTSAQENLFVSGLLAGANAWLGGNDVITADLWEWADGPESGLDFWQGLQGGSPVGGAFTNWGSSDPNNAGGGQYALLLCAQNVSPCLNENLGQWIDRQGSDLQQFVVEYEPGVVPEPSSGLLLCAGLAILAGQRRIPGVRTIRCVMAKSGRRRLRRTRGFTLLELMVTLAVIGLLALIAIPVFSVYQLRSKSAEAKTNLSSLRVLEEAYYSTHDQFLPAAAAPAVIPGSRSAVFTPNAAFTTLGFSPEGRVYFSYGAAVSADASGYTVDAAADIDADGFPQLWGLAKPDAGGAIVAGQVGCGVAALGVEIGPCGPGHGKSVF
jgi:prepilin-type N-terminal cleavage/methylation domain-containing protein